MFKHILFYYGETMTNKQTLKRLANQVASLKQEVEALSTKQAGNFDKFDMPELIKALEKNFRGIKVEQDEYKGQLDLELSKKLTPQQHQELIMLEEEDYDLWDEVLLDHAHSIWGPVSKWLDKVYGAEWDLKNIEETTRKGVVTVYTTIYTPAM